MKAKLTTLGLMLLSLMLVTLNNGCTVYCPLCSAPPPVPNPVAAPNPAPPSSSVPTP